MLPDERFRPSGCGPLFAMALVTTMLAWISVPGSLRHVPLTWTSIFGTRYVARPRNEVMYGSTIRQYGLVNPATESPRSDCVTVMVDQG